MHSGRDLVVSPPLRKLASIPRVNSITNSLSDISIGRVTVAVKAEPCTTRIGDAPTMQETLPFLTHLPVPGSFVRLVVTTSSRECPKIKKFRPEVFLILNFRVIHCLPALALPWGDAKTEASVIGTTVIGSCSSADTLIRRTSKKATLSSIFMSF